MHINHRRGETRRTAANYPYDNRAWKVRGFRVFRAKEAAAIRAFRDGEDADGIVFPERTRDNDNALSYA